LTLIEEEKIMMRFPFILTLCSSLLMITACSFLQTSTSENSSTTTTPKIEETVKSATDRVTNKVRSTIDRTHSVADRAVQSASEQVQGAIAFKEGLQGMSTKVSSTLNAINSGDFPTAQQEFSQLQDNWTGIGNTVQKSSTKVYQQVDSQIKAIASLLNHPNPERTKLVTELNALRKTLTDSFSQL
jgi:hypothetical protein